LHLDSDPASHELSEEVVNALWDRELVTAFSILMLR
jgi:hypothetical protein